MNWTGGRLQRSKANANSLVKTQKQHFAKARLLLQNRHPSHSPIALSVLNGHISRDSQAVDNSASQGKAAEDRSFGPASPSQSPRLRASNGNEFTLKLSPWGARKEKRQRYVEDGISNTGTLEPGGRDRAGRTTLEQNGPARNSQHNSEHTRKSTDAESNTLAKVKQNLLKKSDWIGILATRPLQFVFQATEDMGRIGKRRKISHTNTKQELELEHVSRVQRRRHRNNITGQLHAPTPILHTEDVSIRFGDNIHQSQTTPLLTARGALPPVPAASLSSELMLLDRLDHDVTVRATSGIEAASPDGKAIYSHRSSPASQVEPKLPNLPSLEHFRDSESFDQVKARSVSRSSRAARRTEQVIPSRRRAANRGLLEGAVTSSSVIRGDRLLVSSNGQYSADNDARGHTERREGVMHESHHRTKPGETASLSSSFWPKRGTSDRADEQPMVSSDIAAEQASRPNRRPFTLEQQVSEEDAISGDEMRSRPSAIDARQSTITSGETSKSGVQQESRNLAEVKQTQEGPQPMAPPERPSFIIQNLNKTRESSHTPRKGQSYVADLASNRGTPSQSSTGDPIVGTMPVHISHGASAVDNEPILNPQLPSMREHLLQQAQWPNAQKMPTVDPDLRSSEAASDEGEDWKRFVNFEDLDCGIEFQPRYSKLSNRGCKYGKDQGSVGRPTGQGLLQSFSFDPTALPKRQDSSPSKSVHTSANTVLHMPHEDIHHLRSEDQELVSETDFLTQWSPMEGKLDERLADISVYNNAARSVRSFVPAPSLHAAGQKHLSRTSADLSTQSAEWDQAQAISASSFMFTPARGRHVPKQAVESRNALPLSGSTHRKAHGVQEPTYWPSSLAHEALADLQQNDRIPLTLADGEAAAISTPILNPLPVHSDPVHSPVRSSKQHVGPFPLSYSLFRVTPRKVLSRPAHVLPVGLISREPMHAPESQQARENSQRPRQLPMDTKYSHRHDAPLEATDSYEPNDSASLPRYLGDEFSFADEEAMRLLSTDSADLMSPAIRMRQPSRGRQSALSNIHTEGHLGWVKRPSAPFSSDHLDQIGMNNVLKAPPTSPLRNHELQKPPPRYGSVLGKFKMPDRMIYEGDGEADEIESLSKA